MVSFRSEKTTQAYKAEMQTPEFRSGCALCGREPLQSFVHWKIIENLFPYDLIASEHVMLVPLRHVSENELTEEERDEFMQIKYSDAIQQHYDNFLESTHRTRSIPPHFHLHLIVLKR